jgi:4-aminobutyrate aminotransferase-like enzyme
MRLLAPVADVQPRRYDAAVVNPIPGPRSRTLLQRLKAVESPNVTFVAHRFPVVWQSASGAEVVDVDGNTYLDAGSAFGVALVGHGHPDVVAAAQRQTAELMHGMGDVHPPAVRIELLERLVEIAPGNLGHGVLCTGGSEAVEVALKTALLATGRAGVVSFHGGYHGLSTGALAVTSRADFRDPFAAHLPATCWFSDFPTAAEELAGCLQQVADLLCDPSRDIGLVMVEPIQGRGGTVVPPDGWLRGLADLCTEYGALLCCDEIFTGVGRTGAWFACEADGVVPDLLCVGKALGGGFPISACLGKPEVMQAWGESKGEALHTSTFLGHPVACAAALATLAVIERSGLIDRVLRLGPLLKFYLERELSHRNLGIKEIRGRGLMLGVQAGPRGRKSGTDIVLATVSGCLQRGLIILPAGPLGDVLQLTPPAICTELQLQRMASIIGQAWREAVA